jgi:hypothetical protein
MAGTMRLITNKPDPTHFEAGYDVTGADVSLAAARAARLKGSGEPADQ